ncbi:MAG TPA: response regulator transcription factor, partial [Rhodothermales bacterium]
RDNPWVTGELAFWLWRAGALERMPDDVAEPYANHINGNPEAAADAWDRLGFPYHRALALADCADTTLATDGLRILQDLGARRVAEKISSDLRARGIGSLPRGPRPTTRENPAGLTDRQLEVLALLAEGLTDPEIADRLFISPKTAGHHVSAILSKFGVHTRVEAATRALERGLLAQHRE